jgi:hypothetical protein
MLKAVHLNKALEIIKQERAKELEQLTVFSSFEAKLLNQSEHSARMVFYGS